jgi:serine/threonine protein kinase
MTIEIRLMTSHKASPLGKGSFGQVEKVCWNQNWYARKTMLREEHDEGVSFAALRECDIYSRFHSPFMVSVFRVEILNHQVCLWMGLADMSLAQYIATNPTFAERLQMASRILWAGLNFLNYIHTYNVLHRDIKPDNILLQKQSDGEYNIYISDMGSCRWFTRNLKLTGGMGTQCYRPPEMWEHQYHKPADVFGLGVTVINVLHGAHPVAGANPCTPTTAWKTTLKAYRAYIPSLLYDVLKRMIETQPNQRIGVREALEHDLFAAASIPGVPKMPEIPWPNDYTGKLKMTHEERRVWVDYMVDLGISYSLTFWTLVHAVHAWDDFLGQMTWELMQQHHKYYQQNPLELYSCVALWVASKYFEEQAIALKDLVDQCQHRFSNPQFVDMEECMLTTLGFRIVRRLPLKVVTARMDPIHLKQILGYSGYLQGQCFQLKSQRQTTQKIMHNCKTRIY